MKNLKVEFTALGNNIEKKSNYLMRLIVNMTDHMTNRSSFIEHIKKPLETKITNDIINKDDLINLVNDIMGYHTFLSIKKPTNAKDLFLDSAMHDLKIFLKDLNIKYKTKHHHIYLK